MWGKLATLQATADKNPSNKSVQDLCSLYNVKSKACLGNFETIFKKVPQSKAKVVDQFFQVDEPIATLLEEIQAFDMALLAIETEQDVSPLQEQQRRQQVSTEQTQQKQDK